MPNYEELGLNSGPFSFFFHFFFEKHLISIFIEELKGRPHAFENAGSKRSLVSQGKKGFHLGMCLSLRGLVLRLGSLGF